MKPLQGKPEDAADALRSVLQFLALEPEAQLRLYQEPKECTNCRVGFAYSDLLARYEDTPFFRSLSPSQAEALASIQKTGTSVLYVRNHCHEPHLLSGGPWADLRQQATSALELFGWASGAPNPLFLPGQPEYSAAWHAEDARQKKLRLGSRGMGGTSIRFRDIPQFDPRGQNVDSFRERLSQVPWFSRLGEPHSLDKTVDRISDWDDWGGPESDGSGALGIELGRWEEALQALPQPGGAALSTLRSSVEDQVYADMPFGPEEDPWHGPTFASMQGAAVAATIACCLLAGAPIPKNALRQWAWFARGHWPCGYSEDDELPRDEEGQVLQQALDKARLVVY
jgi:hypothetical protein